MLKSFRELEVWQKSHQLVLAVYRLTSSFPRDERFGFDTELTAIAQMIAALSRSLKHKLAAR